MKIIKLRCNVTETILYEGAFETASQCLEHAIKDRANITNVNLRNLDLNCANLDEAIFHFADFTNANLTGANLSGATFTDCRFHGAALYNTFLCHSHFRHCGFEGASFGGTDIMGAWLEDCRFSTLSCFSLDFVQARTMRGSSFTDARGNAYPMTRPPLVVRGTQLGPICLMDGHIKIGARIMPASSSAAHLQFLKGIEKMQKLKTPVA